MGTLVVNPYLYLWTPSQASPYLWYDFSDIDSLAIESGKIAQVNDKGSSGVNGIQLDSALRASYDSSGMNGKPCAIFPGISYNGLTITFPSVQTTPWKIYIVFEDNGTVNTVSGLIAGEAGYGLVQYGVNTYVVDGSGASNVNSSVVSTSVNTPTMLSAFYTENSTHNSFIYKNGSLVSNYVGTGMAVVAKKNYALGYRPDNISTRWFKGKIGEVVVALDSNYQQNIEGYLAHKWGLTANLPVTHPYKNTPPYV